MIIEIPSVIVGYEDRTTMFVGWGVTRSVSNRASADHGTDKRKMLRMAEMRSSARLGSMASG